jgi:hypothetical protein
MYKPHFCCDCGSRIERTRWHLWTSRRFCSDCAPRFRKKRLLLSTVTCATLLSVGLLIGRTTRPAPPPLLVERGELPTVTAPVTKEKGKRTSEETDSNAPASSPKPEPTYGPDGTPTERPTEASEIITICGARTQKGTPCQRRVRGTGRCWQHRGMPAMIPLEKRIVTGA